MPTAVWMTNDPFDTEGRYSDGKAVALEIVVAEDKLPVVPGNLIVTTPFIFDMSISGSH